MRPLIERISEPKALRKALEELSSRPQSSGLSGETLANFRWHGKKNIDVLSKSLKDGSFGFSPVKGVSHRKPGQSKPRPLRISEIRDRVVLKAILQSIEPKLIRKYGLTNDASFAYLTGQTEEGFKRTRQGAWDKIKSEFAKGKVFALRGDIEKFFDKIKREVLFDDMILPLFNKDISINRLLNEGMDQEIANLEQIRESHRYLFEGSTGGIPQGNSLSPLFANVYLAGFDKGMRERGFTLIRYADDIVVLGMTVESVKAAYTFAATALSRLGLRLYPTLEEDPHATKFSEILKICSSTPLTFLSVSFNGRDLFPSNEAYGKLINKLGELTDERYCTDVRALLDKFGYAIDGWITSFSFTRVEKYLAKINRTVNELLGEALINMGWKLKKLDGRRLSKSHRMKSGILFAEAYLAKARAKSASEEIVQPQSKTT
ncbi:MAG: reverse transcriptase domain-containing protein [Candidatus Kapaibacterium sp.]